MIGSEPDDATAMVSLPHIYKVSVQIELFRRTAGDLAGIPTARYYTIAMPADMALAGIVIVE